MALPYGRIVRRGPCLYITLRKRGAFWKNDMSANVETIRHSASHVMAEAVLKLYPGTKLGIGPAIEDGFYYDFQFAKPIQAEDLPAIEKEMRRIIASDAEFVRKEVSKDEARKLLRRPALQARADRGPRGDHLDLRAGRLRRPLPRPPRRDHPRDPARRLQAPLGRRRLLARRREAADAHPHLRLRLREQGGARGPPQDARGGREARPPQARQGARPLLDPRGGRSGSRSTGTPRAAASASSSRTGGARSTTGTATRSSSLPTSARAGSGRPRATSASTRRACTRP